MSIFEVKVVPVKLENHPGADSLSIVNVNGYTVCVRTEDWQGIELGCFIEPESICPNTPLFAFLGGKNLIKARKIRGIPSFGLLVPAPDGAQPGDNVADILGITHYDPPTPEELERTGQPRLKNINEDEATPQGYIPVYDLENARKYNYVFTEGEPVNCFEKINGENIRVKFDAVEGCMRVASHYRWKKEDTQNGFWKSLKYTPEVESFCRDHPNCTVYGESAGKVKGYKYGMQNGETRIFVFDILRDGRWLDYDEAKALVAPYGVTWCPIIAEAFPYDFDTMTELAEGQSWVPGANHGREGIVVSPIKERVHHYVGRVKMKFVSLAYLEGKH